LKKELANVESVIDIQLYNGFSGEYSVQVSNSRWLVLNSPIRNAVAGGGSHRASRVSMLWQSLRRKRSECMIWLMYVTRLPHRGYAT